MTNCPTKEEIQKILYDFANKNIPNDSKEHDVLYNTLLHHPEPSEKIGAGIDYFFVQKSKWRFNQFNFMIKRIDGSQVDFSFLKCLNNKTIKRTSTRAIENSDENWNRIFREIIIPQISSFREKAFESVGTKDKFICSETKLKVKKIFAHVDHVYPLTFQSILVDFLKSRSLNLKQIDLTEDVGTSETLKIKDELLRNDFYNFHAERCVLRIVCSTANLQSKRTNDYNKKDPTKAKLKLLKIYPQYHLNSNN